MVMVLGYEFQPSHSEVMGLVTVKLGDENCDLYTTLLPGKLEWCCLNEVWICITVFFILTDDLQILQQTPAVVKSSSLLSSALILSNPLVRPCFSRIYGWLLTLCSCQLSQATDFAREAFFTLKESQINFTQMPRIVSCSGTVRQFWLPPPITFRPSFSNGL